MSTVASEPQLILSEEEWDELLLYLENHQVIPIVGPELITISDPPGTPPVPLVRWLAPRLAEFLRVPEAANAVSLNEVACAYLLTDRSDRRRIYNGIRLLLRDAHFQPPDHLVGLAEITDFDLFLCTTFDPLLAQALERARPGFSRKRDVLAYDTKPSQPFPDPVPASLVYHILGRLDSFPEFAVWEEDYMEFLCHLIEQSRETALESLFRLLRSRHLLLLGAPFSDWIVRFFLRTARGRRLTDPRESGARETLAERRINLGEPTVFFFDRLARATRVVDGSPVAFVEELVRRWKKRRNDSPTAADFLQRMANEMPRGAVFISYCREDSAVATRLAMTLAAANIPVWIDTQRLRAGEHFEQRLEHAVREDCSFFIPIISPATEGHPDRFVHKERAWAATRYQEGFVFCLPVVLPGVEEIGGEPPCFAKVQREKLPADGAPPEGFVRRVRQLVEEWRSSGRPRA